LSSNIEHTIAKISKINNDDTSYNFNYHEYYCILKRINIINNIYGDYYTSLMDDTAILESV